MLEQETEKISLKYMKQKLRRKKEKRTSLFTTHVGKTSQAFQEILDGQSPPNCLQIVKNI